MSTPTDEELGDDQPVPDDEPVAEDGPERSAVEERDFLLRSLDDLDAEYEAGDLDQEDYETLRDGYVARTATVLRAIEEHHEAPAEAPSTRRSRRRTVSWIVGVVAVASLCGWLLARSVGTKGSGDTITGNAVSPLDSCQTLAFQKPAQGIACYDRILRSQPDNADALTYKGWALVRSGKTTEGTKLFDQVVAQDPTYPDVHVFLASVKANAGDFRGAQDELDTLYSLNPPAGVISTLQSQGLDREIAFGLLSKPTQACWTKAEDAIELLTKDAKSAKAATEITDALTCLHDVLAATPHDLDALEASGYLLGSLGGSALYTQAHDDLTLAIQLSPTDATAYLLRAALENSSGSPSDALADLATLKTLGRPSPLYPVATPAAIEQDATQQLAQATTTTGGR